MVRTLSMALFFFLSAKPRTTIRTQRLICFSLFPTLCYRIPMDGSYTPKHFSPLFSRLVHRVLVSFSFLCFERERQRKGWPAKTRVTTLSTWWSTTTKQISQSLYSWAEEKSVPDFTNIPEKNCLFFRGWMPYMWLSLCELCKIQDMHIRAALNEGRVWNF